MSGVCSGSQLGQTRAWKNVRFQSTMASQLREDTLQRSNNIAQTLGRLRLWRSTVKVGPGHSRHVCYWRQPVTRGQLSKCAFNKWDWGRQGHRWMRTSLVLRWILLGSPILCNKILNSLLGTAKCLNRVYVQEAKLYLLASCQTQDDGSNPD